LPATPPAEKDKADPVRLISIVSPCYEEEDNVPELYERTKAVMAQFPAYGLLSLSSGLFYLVYKLIFWKKFSVGMEKERVNFDVAVTRNEPAATVGNWVREEWSIPAH
jgi:hypothetical protein